MIYTVTFNPAIDYVVRLDKALEVGEVNRAAGEDCVLGGKGINVSGVLHELGCESVALGFVAGETGAWLERGLAAQGLRTDFIHLDHGMTRINVKIKAGEETELNGAGPAIPASALHALEEKLDALTENDVLILAGSIPSSMPQDTYERLLARLDGKGVRCVVDATRACWQMFCLPPFLIKPNNHELGELVGRVLTGDEEITRRRPRPANAGCPERSGEHGGRWCFAGGRDRCRAPHRLPKGRVVTAWAQATAWWLASWPDICRPAAMTTPSVWAPPAAAPRRSAGAGQKSEIDALLAAL